MTVNTTSLNGGKFQKGNPGGPGNPHARRVNELRSVILGAVSPDDILDVISVLLKKALAGDLHAIRELLDRTIGKCGKIDIVRNTQVNVDARKSSPPIPTEQFGPITADNMEFHRAALGEQLQRFMQAAEEKERKESSE